ncbi:MAG: DciA family protein [Myxococcota bacterium]|nr:DciA family protein [Myxococcota bacterium]
MKKRFERNKRRTHTAGLPEAIRELLGPLAEQATSAGNRLTLSWADLIGLEASSASMPVLHDDGHLEIQILEPAWQPVIEDMKPILLKRLRSQGFRVTALRYTSSLSSAARPLSPINTAGLTVGRHHPPAPDVEETISRLRQSVRRGHRET